MRMDRGGSAALDPPYAESFSRNKRRRGRDRTNTGDCARSKKDAHVAFVQDALRIFCVAPAAIAMNRL
jgi:hypothetical protein